jgi:DNA-binding XRE family transcriptional regulator
VEPAFRAMLAEDRKRSGWSMGQVAWRLGVSIREYRELEAGASWPNWETWDRICELYGWPQTFATGVRSRL